MPLGAGHYLTQNPEWLRDGQPADTTRRSLERQNITTDVAAALTSGVMLGVGIPLEVGDTISSLGFAIGATAANAPTHAFVALYDTAATPNLIAQSLDTTSTAIAASAYYEQTLATPATGVSLPYYVTKSGIYIAALMVAVSTTVPSLLCKVMPTVKSSAGYRTGQLSLASTSGSGLTTAAPATWASPTNVVNVAYALAHS